MSSPYTAKQIATAREALDLINQRLDLEQPSDPGTDLYHLLAALLEWSDSVPVDFDDILSQVRADFALDADASAKADVARALRLTNADGHVRLTLEQGAATKDVGVFGTIADAEAYLTLGVGIDPVALLAGDYCIAAPHGVGHDDEAVAAAKRLGFKLFYSMGGAYYTRLGDPQDKWSKCFENTAAAALAALSTIDPDEPSGMEEG